jgi:hypothetical protein
MQDRGVVKVTVSREASATATAPAQITPVRELAEPANARGNGRENGGHENGVPEDGASENGGETGETSPAG